MRESTLWILHILAAVVILVALGIHIAIMHLDFLMGVLGAGGGDVLAYASVMERSDALSHTVIYIVLLATALYHGFYGFRSICYELPLGRTLERTVDIASIAAGFGFFFWGSYAVIVGFLA
jgi:succinate dehydrogenase / fumarate reductase membrane anchor subunit